MENYPYHHRSLTGGALFAVVFFDGEKEIDLGTILITHSINFKEFQSLISHKIGISPHQITTYFTPFHHHRRRPVTNKFDFAGVLPESGTSYFWVVLKRSRRVRRRRPKQENISPGNFVLLRRDPNLDYLERYMMSLNLNSGVYHDMKGNFGFGLGFRDGLGSDDGGSSSGGGSGSENRAVFCGVCWNARIDGETAPFHCCKNDAVANGFRPFAGPIGPPLKN